MRSRPTTPRASPKSATMRTKRPPSSSFLASEYRSCCAPAPSITRSWPRRSGATGTISRRARAEALRLLLRLALPPREVDPFALRTLEVLRRESRVFEDGREHRCRLVRSAELLHQQRVPHARLGARVVAGEGGILLERPAGIAGELERARVDQMAVRRAEARIALAEPVERLDRLPISGRGELRVRERQQDFRIVLEKPGTRIAADADRLVVTARLRQLVGVAARRLDARITLVLEQRRPHPSRRIDDVLHALQCAARRQALIERRQNLREEVDQRAEPGNEQNQKNPAHVAARAQNVQDRESLDDGGKDDDWHGSCLPAAIVGNAGRHEKIPE